MRSKEIFWKKPPFGWKKRFWPVFLVLPVMLLKTQLFEKELFWPSFFVLCSIKNLSEQLITAHFVSWHFFCIIKLHSVRTYEADGEFSKIILSFRWFWPVSSRNTEYRDIRKQTHWPKKDSINFCASYKIISATTGWMLKRKIFKKMLPFQWKKNNFTFFLVIRNFADVHNNFIILHKVIKQIWCKWKGKFSKIWSVVENEVFWKKTQTKRHTFQWKKVSFFLFELPSMTNLKNNFYGSRRSFDIHCTINKI